MYGNQRGFLDADGVTPLDHDALATTNSGQLTALAGGVTEWNPDDAAVKRKAITVAERVIAAADSGKFGQTGFVRICSLADPSLVITDSAIAADQLEALRSVNSHVLLTK